MKMRRPDFRLLVVLAAAAMAMPAWGQTTGPTRSSTQSAVAIPDFSGVWAKPYVGIEPPRSGPGPVTNRSRRNLRRLSSKPSPENRTTASSPLPNYRPRWKIICPTRDMISARSDWHSTYKTSSSMTLNRTAIGSRWPPARRPPWASPIRARWFVRAIRRMPPRKPHPPGRAADSGRRLPHDDRPGRPPSG